MNFKSTSNESLTINEAFPYAEGMTAAQGYTAADNIQVMTEDGGYDIDFLSNGDYGKNSHSTELENKWAKTGTSVVTTDKFPVGGGAWYVSRNKSGAVKFLNPLAK